MGVNYMNDNNAFNNSNNKYSWPVIILFLILFFPIGFFFIYKRFTTNKANYLKNSKTLAKVSYVMIGLGIIYFILGISADSGNFMASFGLIGIGIFLLFLSKKLKKDSMEQEQSEFISMNYNEEMNSQINDIPSNNETCSVTCKNCGANSIVKTNQICECEYCGSPIQFT